MVDGSASEISLPSGDIDPAAQALAHRIGGLASVLLPGFGNREFDAVSDRYVAQTTSASSAVSKPTNFLTPARRRQIRATLQAAKSTGRQALFEFTAGVPAPTVVAFIHRNAERIGVTVDLQFSEVSAP